MFTTTYLEETNLLESFIISAPHNELAFICEMDMWFHAIMGDKGGQQVISQNISRKGSEVNNCGFPMCSLESDLPIKYLG